MAMNENIRDGIRTRKAISGDAIVEQFTEALTIALEKFIKRLNSGQLDIDNITDLQRVYLMWKEISEFNDRANNQSSALPAIRSSEIKALEDSGIVSEDGTAIDLAGLSADEMEKMALSFMNAVNNENVGDV